MRTPSPSDLDDAVRTVVVAVPAHDEAPTIGRCLESIDCAAAVCGRPVHVVVAADRCTDGTEAVVAATPTVHAAVEVVRGRWGTAGATRRAAVAMALERAGHGRHDVWLANTDADGHVAPSWLADQLSAAEDGADLVLGTVVLDDLAPAVLVERFAVAYEAGADVEGHRHVHAANLGIRASSYELIGGWGADAVGEEHDLLARAIDAGLRIRRPVALAVTTSSRTTSRVVGGFATDLARLAEPA